MGSFWKIAAFCSALLFSSLVLALNEELVITNADRAIDVSSQLVKIAHRLTLSNTGKSAVNSFTFLVAAAAKNDLSFFEAQVSDSKKILVSTQTVDADGNLAHSITLDKALEAGQTRKVRVDLVFTHHLKTFPEFITQKEKQLVQYRGSAYILSPYKIVAQTTKVSLSSSNVESFTKVKPSSQSDSMITYGPYNNVAPLSTEDVVIHFENNSPFLSIAPLIRTIEVSHWGNIAVEETIDMYHTGAKLKGSFSRFEYQREQSGVSSVKGFKTLLPPSASDVYYRDEIGNISTSNLREEDDGVELELRPRFPLFGGWKTHYVIGYNLPSYEYLYNSGDQFVLKMPLIDHIVDNMVVDETQIRIILPEGATNIELDTPYDVKRLEDSLHFTYLDTKGRPVVEITANNLVEHHIQDFKLSYKLSWITMLQEPLLCVLAFFILFVTAIIYTRLDFSISKDEANENRLRTAGMAEVLRGRYLKRMSLYHQFEEQIQKLKGYKDPSAYQAVTRNILADLKLCVIEVSTSMRSENASLVDKVLELQNKKRLTVIC